MSDIHFEYPWVFAFLLLFVICGYLCKARSEAIIFPHLDIFIATKSASSWKLRLLKYISILFALTALASPIQTNKMQIENKEGYAIVLAIDASGSMKYGFSDSYLPSFSTKSKFLLSKNILSKFVEKRPNDQIGLVVFGNFAYIASPLTYDKNSIKQIINTLYATIAGSNYTVINDALFQGAKLFEKTKAKSKVLILLTDGQSRGDNVPFDVSMRMIKDMGVKVYTVGIGNKGDFNGAYLDLIAKESSGKTFSANSPKALQKVYAQIDKLEKSKIENNTYIKKNYLYELPLFIAFMALLFYTYLLNKRATA